MTNYNERLDEIIERYAEAIGGYVNFGSPFNSDEDNIAGAEALYQISYNEAKQAITSLIKELVTEAKPTNSVTQRGSITIYGDLSERDLKIVNQFEQNLLKALEEV